MNNINYICYLLASSIYFPTQIHTQIIDLSTCAPNERPSFIKLAHNGEDPVGTAEVVIPGQNLIDCALFCIENQNGLGGTFPCTSFDYIYDTKSCMLSSSGPQLEDTLPTLTVDGPKFAGAGFHQTGFYQKLCFRALSASYVSPNTSYTFERIPMKVLLGATEEIVKADTLAQCLGACLEAHDLFDFLCRSAMYYYETRDCLLNVNDRTLSLESLSEDTEGFIVDYFENHVVSAECGPGTVPQYMILVGKDMIKEHDFIIHRVTRRTCQHFCTVNRAATGQVFMCKAYAYRSRDLTCYLMDEKARPGGPGKVATVDGVEIYEKICLNAENTCVKSPAFERVPDHVLIGSAKVILEDIRSYERCLSECMRSESTLSFYCLSAMYYFETGECVLNTDNRLTDTGKRSFSNQTGDTPVDYYDNLCMDSNVIRGIPTNACPVNTHSTFIEYLDTEQPEFHRQTFSGVTVQECLVLCDDSKNFTCNSVDYRDSDSTCTLSHVDSRTSPLIEIVGTNHYERHCLEGARFLCRDLAVSFTAYRGHKISTNSFLNVSGISLDECLSVCLQDPAKTCLSVNYYLPDSKCELYSKTAADEILVRERDNDYYESQCIGAQAIQRSPGGFLGETLAQVRDVEIITDCQYGGMKIIASSSEPFTGYVFTKNKFGTCRTDIENGATGELTLTFPTSGFHPQGSGIANNGHQGQAGSNAHGHGSQGSQRTQNPYGDNQNGQSHGGSNHANSGPSSLQGGQHPYNENLNGHRGQGAISQGGQNSYGVNNQNTQGGFNPLSANQNANQNYNNNPQTSGQVPVQNSFGGYPATIGPQLNYPTPPVQFPQGSYQPQAEQFNVGVGHNRVSNIPSGYQNLPTVSPAPYPNQSVPQQTFNYSFSLNNNQGPQSYQSSTFQTNPPFSPAPYPNQFTEKFPAQNQGYGTPNQSSPSPKPPQIYPNFGVQKSVTATKLQGEEYALDPITLPTKKTETTLKSTIEYNEETGKLRSKRDTQTGHVPVQGDCGVVEVSRMKYSAIIIVTTNNLGVPGLVTEQDKFYNVTCDYTASAQSKVTATAPGIAVSNQPNVPELHPEGQIYIPAPVVISLQRGVEPVTMATLGEPLTLAFDYVQSFNPELMGIFIRQCNASRAYGYPPHPDPLVLIEDGCPMPAVQQAIVPGPISESATGFSMPFTVFKFDGGPSVKISCYVDFCEGQCNPTTCNINGSPEPSYGRKKRNIHKKTNTKDKLKMVGLKKKTQIRTMIFTVVDKLPIPISMPDNYDQLPANQHKEEMMQNYIKTSENNGFLVVDPLDAGHRQICLKKSSFLGIFLFLGILCMCQVSAISAYFVQKLVTIRKSSNQSVGEKKLLQNKEDNE